MSHLLVEFFCVSSNYVNVFGFKFQSLQTIRIDVYAYNRRIGVCRQEGKPAGFRAYVHDSVHL